MSNEPEKQNICHTLESNYMPYAMSVIISRAIPEIDGFKPSHRKLLYTMYKMGLLTGNRTKSANVVGQTMKLNPHGDGAIYETMVRMTRGNAALLHPLVDSKGNFGKEYSRDMAYAASRYTEVKLDEFCNEFFKDIDKNTVEFVDNYDNTLKEPTLLPVTFPSILTNCNTGIAVGMASNICSFNLKELCCATIAYLKDQTVNLADYLIAPDFPGGGQLIYKREEMEAIYKTGRGSFRLRAKYRYDKKHNCIDVFEIPYTTTSEAIVEKVVELIKAGKLREIVDVRDETDLSGLKITFDLRRGVDPDKLMTMLYSKTPLEDSFGCNFNILIDGEPHVLGVGEILGEWARFRKGCIKNRLKFDIDKKSEKLHLLQGLAKILLDIDKAIAIIRNTQEEAMVVPNLMAGFEIDQVQAEFVAEIKLRNLNKEYILKRTGEISDLEKEISELSRILSKDSEISKIIIKDLEQVSKKYGKDRCTEIVEPEEIEVYSEEAFIEDYNVRLFLTRDNYFKKISLVSLRSAGEQKLKEDDEIVAEAEVGNRSDILFFSSKCCVYKVKTYDMNDCKASVLGDYLPNLLEMEEDEKIVFMTATENYAGEMLFAFENGKIARVPLKSYETKTNRKRLINAYSDASPLCGVMFLAEDAVCCVESSNNKLLVFDAGQVPQKTTKSTRGVQVLTCRKNTKMTRLCLASESGLINPEKYRAKNLPAAGFFRKEEDRPEKQVSLFDGGEEDA